MHNHLMIDLVEAMFQGDRSEAYWKLRKEISSAVPRSLSIGDQAHVKKPIIFTACCASNKKDEETASEYINVARERRARFYWINLECEDEEEHLRRGTNVSRARHTSKLTDSRRLLEMRKHRLLQASDCQTYFRSGHDGSLVTDDFRLIQVASQNVDDTVTEILSFLTETPSPPKSTVKNVKAETSAGTPPPVAGVTDTPKFDFSFSPAEGQTGADDIDWDAIFAEPDSAGPISSHTNVNTDSLANEHRNSHIQNTSTNKHGRPPSTMPVFIAGTAHVHGHLHPQQQIIDANWWSAMSLSGNQHVGANERTNRKRKSDGVNGFL
jgi:hypothetical protein